MLFLRYLFLKIRINNNNNTTTTTNNNNNSNNNGRNKLFTKDKFRLADKNPFSNNLLLL
jgi:hypothetical protein